MAICLVTVATLAMDTEAVTGETLGEVGGALVVVVVGGALEVEVEGGALEEEAAVVVQALELLQVS